jgi:hypothetical protein
MGAPFGQVIPSLLSRPGRSLRVRSLDRVAPQRSCGKRGPRSRPRPVWAALFAQRLCSCYTWLSGGYVSISGRPVPRVESAYGRTNSAWNRKPFGGSPEFRAAGTLAFCQSLQSSGKSQSEPSRRKRVACKDGRDPVAEQNLHSVITRFTAHSGHPPCCCAPRRPQADGGNWRGLSCTVEGLERRIRTQVYGAMRGHDPADTRLTLEG